MPLLTDINQILDHLNIPVSIKCKGGIKPIFINSENNFYQSLNFFIHLR